MQREHSYFVHGALSRNNRQKQHQALPKEKETLMRCRCFGKNTKVLRTICFRGRLARYPGPRPEQLVQQQVRFMEDSKEQDLHLVEVLRVGGASSTSPTLPTQQLRFVHGGEIKWDIHHHRYSQGDGSGPGLFLAMVHPRVHRAFLAFPFV